MRRACELVEFCNVSSIGMERPLTLGLTDIVHDDDGSGAANPVRYTGMKMDETGLYFYRARYYSPQMGRFISEDPIGFAGGDVNFYSYVGNRTVNEVDPLGLYDMPGGESGYGPGSIGYPYPFYQYPPDLYDRKPLSLRTKCMIACNVAFFVPCTAGGVGASVAATPAIGVGAGLACRGYFALLCTQICPDEEPQFCLSGK